jgi:hypothetical protein
LANLSTTLHSSPPGVAEIIEYLEEHDPVPNWDEPEMPDDVLKDAKRAYDAIRGAVH